MTLNDNLVSRIMTFITMVAISTNEKEILDIATKLIKEINEAAKKGL